MTGPPLKEPGAPGPTPETHEEHDWNLLETGITNTTESHKVSMPTKVFFVCHCGAYKLVETKRVNKKHYR